MSAFPPGLLALLSQIQAVGSGPGDENDFPYQDADAALSDNPAADPLAAGATPEDLPDSGMGVPDLGMPSDQLAMSGEEGFPGQAGEEDPAMLAAIQALLQGAR